MKRFFALLLGSVLALASLTAALFQPVSAPVLFDALAGIGAAAGLLLVCAQDFRPMAPVETRPAVHVKRLRAQRAAARAASRANQPHRTVAALIEIAG